MRTSRRALFGIVAVLLGLSAPHRPADSAAPAADGKVTLRDISYDDLGKLVTANKGKVVVVDFWGEY